MVFSQQVIMFLGNLYRVEYVYGDTVQLSCIRTNREITVFVKDLLTQKV